MIYGKVSIDLTRLNWHFIRGDADPELQNIQRYLGGEYSNESLDQLIRFIGYTEFSLYAPEEFVCSYLVQDDFRLIDEKTVAALQAQGCVPAEISYSTLTFANFNCTGRNLVIPSGRDNTIACVVQLNERIVSYYILDEFYAEVLNDRP